jgi:hypothetical protein
MMCLAGCSTARLRGLIFRVLPDRVCAAEAPPLALLTLRLCALG